MLSAADSEPLNDYFQGEFWPADEVNHIDINPPLLKDVEITPLT